MKNISKKFLAFLLAFVLLLSSSANVFATNNGNDSKLTIKVVESEQTEEAARSTVEAYKEHLATTKGLSNDKIEEEKLRVVVEVEGLPTISEAITAGMKLPEVNKNLLQSQESKLLNSQAAVQSAMRASGIETKVLNSMTAVINAFSTEVKVSDIEKIKQLDGVKDVFISNEYERPQMKTSLDQVAARQAWDLGFKGQGTILAVVDSGIDPSHKDFVMSEDVNLALDKSEVNELINNEKLPGKYYSDKVVYAYNYYDLNDNVKDIGGSQHGQHVAGTMAANGDESNGGIKGVAPDAQLLGMKVFSSDIRYATTFSDIYVKAIDDAIKLGADAINLSLGSPAGFYKEDSLEQKVLEKAQENGVVTTISAGNERNIVSGKTPALGENPDTGLLGSPSANKGAFSIAAFENTVLRVAAAHLLPEHTEGFLLELTEAGGAPETSTLANEEGLDYIFVGTGTKEEFDELGEEVSGKVAIAERGNTFSDTIKNGNEAGAAAVLVFNHESGGEKTVSMAGGEGSLIPFAFLKRSAGLELKAAKEANPETRIVFEEDLVSVGNPSANQMSSFSSWGPTPDLQLKPEITASGGNIYSTQNNDSYTTMSGTSMSAPHVAGGVGVVRQFVNQKIEENVFPAMEEGSQLSEFVQLLLMNSADVKAHPEYPDEIYSPRQQGAGLMNLYKATTNLVTVTDADENATSYGEGKLELGQVGESLERKIKLTNYGEDDVTLVPRLTLLQEAKLSQEDFDYFLGLGYPKELIEAAIGKLGSLQEYSETILDEKLDPVTVKAGENLELTLPFDFSQARTRNFVEGFVTFEKDEAQVLSLPFLGFKGSWDEPRIIDTFDGTNLLNTPGEADDTIRIINPAQESQFKSSAFYQSGMMGGFLGNPNKVVLSPGNLVYNMLVGSGNAIPIVSQLRNAKHTEFQVLSEDGKLLRTIFQTDNTRKIYRLDGGNNPFSIVSNAKWDGKLNGVNALEGAYVYRIASTIDYKDARPQYDDFNFVIDDTKPEFVEVSEGLSYDFDEETMMLTIRAKDLIPEGLDADKIAGLKNVTLYNPVTKETTFELVDDHVLVDEAQNLYEFNIDLNKHLKTGINSLELRLMDEAWNSSDNKIVIGEDKLTINDETPANIYLETPELLEIYGGDPDQDLYSVPVKGYVWGWTDIDSITIAGNEVEFTKGDIVVNDLGAGISYEGPGFIFDTNVDFKEGYHEAKLEVKKKGYTDFSIARRFWVDLTLPELITDDVYTSKETSIDLNLQAKDNFSFVGVERNGNIILNKDVFDTEGFAGSIVTSFDDRLEGLEEGINKVTYTVFDSLYEVEKDVYVVVNSDLDISELVAAIKDGESITGSYYQPSLDALAQAIEAGKQVLENKTPSQEEVDQAAKDIRDAIAALTAPASQELKDNLQELVDKVEALDKELLTEESIQALNEALVAAKEVLAGPEATDYDVYMATMALQNALDQREYKKIAPVVEATDKEIYVGDEFDPKSIFTAKDKFGNDVEFEVSGELDTNKVGEYTLTAVAVADELEASAQAVVTVLENDKTQLKAKLDEVKALDQSKYSDLSVNFLQVAIDEAELVVANENATKAEIANALTSLEEAYRGLVEEDRTPIIYPIDKTIGVGASIDLRTLFSAQAPDGSPLIAVVEAEVDTSEVGVYEIEGKVTYEGNTASAKAKLNVVENDKTSLIAAIDLAAKYDLSKYTETSVASLRAALAKAKDVRTNINATMEEIIPATKELLTAIRSLKEAEEKPAPKLVSGYVLETGVNVRDVKTSEVVGVVNMGKYLKGYLDGDYFMTTINGKDVKVHKSLVVIANPEKYYVKNPANARDELFKVVGKVLPGKMIDAVRLGDYYRYWEEGQGVRLVYHTYVSKDEVKPYAKAYFIKENSTNVRENVGGKIVGKKMVGEKIYAYKLGNYLVFEEAGKTLSVWADLTIAQDQVKLVTVSATSAVNIRDAKTNQVVRVAKLGEKFTGRIIGNYLFTSVDGRDVKIYADYVK